MIDRLHELNRILDAASTLAGAGPGHEIPLDSLLRLCRSSVRHGLLPDHARTVQFALEIGFLTSIGSDVQITEEGRLFMSLNPECYYELTADQARLLVHRQYLGGRYRDKCRTIFKRFAISEDPPRLVWSEVDDAAIEAEPWLLSHLCQLGLLVRTEAGYASSNETVDRKRPVLPP